MTDDSRYFLPQVTTVVTDTRTTSCMTSLHRNVSKMLLCVEELGAYMTAICK